LVREDEGCAAEPAESADVLELWPEHVPAVELWFAVQTQWRHGFSGPTGLDYAGVRASPRFRALPHAMREGVFADVCTMERATLRFWRQRK
jgi:hypothetical protein